jgi:hypothetical protein
MKAGATLTFHLNDLFPQIVGKILEGKFFYINAQGTHGKLIADKWEDGPLGYSITHTFTEEEAREVDGQKCRLKAKITFEGANGIPGPLTLTIKEQSKVL